MKIRFRKTKYIRNAIDENVFKTWEKAFPEYKDKLTYPEFRKHCNGILGQYIDEIAVNPNGVRLPYYMGDMKLSFIPKIGKVINLKASAQLDKDIPYVNLATNGRIGKIVWSCDNARKFNKYLPIIAFSPSKKLTDVAKTQFRNNPELFQDNTRTIRNRNVIENI